MTLGYGIIPHEWLTFANGYLDWGDTSKFVFTATRTCSFFPWHWPFNLDYPARARHRRQPDLRRVLGLNIFLFVMWQKRNEVAGRGGRRSRCGGRASAVRCGRCVAAAAGARDRRRGAGDGS